MRAGIAIALVFSLVACGSEDLAWWESAAAGERIYLLNKRTGDLYTVQDGEIRPVVRNVEEPWEGPAEPVDHEEVARMHSLDQSQWLFDDVVKVDLNTKYRNGQVEIRGTIEPFMKRLGQPSTVRVFRIEFQDWDSFRVLKADLKPSDLVAVVAPDGQSTSLDFTTRVPVAPEDWQEAAFVSVQWVQQTEDIVNAWKQQNPKDTAERKELASAEREARQAEFEERLAQLREAREQDYQADPDVESELGEVSAEGIDTESALEE